jgi:hypothetical protein
MAKSRHARRGLPTGWLAAAVLLGGAGWAQGASLATGEGEGFLGYRRGLVWREPLALASTGSASGAARRPQLGSAQLGGERFSFGDASDEIAARLLVEPPPVTRETLEGAGEELQLYHGLPGGIVLGLEASVGAELAAACAGARLEGSLDGGLALGLADGRRLRLPAIAPDVLRALLEFGGSGHDSLVDLHGAWAEPRLAPAFAGGPLAEELVRMDRLPHARRPETRAWKTLIVDRAVRIDARGDALVLGRTSRCACTRPRTAASSARAGRRARARSRRSERISWALARRRISAPSSPRWRSSRAGSGSSAGPSGSIRAGWRSSGAPPVPGWRMALAGDRGENRPRSRAPAPPVMSTPG